MAPTRTRLSLNKRVAYPCQPPSNGSPATTISSATVKTTPEGLPLPFSTAKYQPNQMMPTVAPPTTDKTVPLPPPSIQPTQLLISSSVDSGNTSLSTNDTSGTAVTTDDASSIDLDEAFEFCKKIFDNVLDSMPIDKASTIRKRIENMYATWTENKLNRSAKIELYRIAKGIFFLAVFTLNVIRVLMLFVCHLHFFSFFSQPSTEIELMMQKKIIENSL